MTVPQKDELVRLRGLLLADKDRAPVPETRPDTVARVHPLTCKCEPCARPEAQYWRRFRITDARDGVTPMPAHAD